MNTTAALPSTAPAAPTTAWTLPIEGMTCASCVARVEKALKKVSGVLSAEVNLVTEKLQVTVRGDSGAAEALIAAVEKAGYNASLEGKGIMRKRRAAPKFSRTPSGGLATPGLGALISSRAALRRFPLYRTRSIVP